ncbi:hypothetical protein E3G68_005083 [Mycobacteroides abscessus]|uniref:SDR family oxidoreductase n=1 Tax=Mycobacteroides abscessus TaxID=36809 RepID=UPI0018782520|nr:hypothetical protein [Mycobacteroides abscessus]
MTDKKLQGRAALVTGAASGNGAAIAERLCADGAQVWLADRNEEGLNATVANWPDELAARAHTVVFDVTDDNAIATAFGKLRRLDILVNNAGVVEGSAFPQLCVDAFSRVLDVNLLGAYRCTKAAESLLRQEGYGRVINITSMEAHHLLATGGHVQPHYNSSKAALDMLTKALAFELAPHRVTVNAVAPGVIETPFTASALTDPALSQWVLEHVPAGRIGRASDVAAVTAFLASPDSEFVTGASIPVDGGFTLGWYRNPQDKE